MVNKPTFLMLELIILFLMMPIILVLNIHPIFKVTPILLGVIYCIWVSVKYLSIPIQSLYFFNFKEHWKSIMIKFFITLVGSVIIMYLFNPENLFIVVRKNWIMWVSFSIIYSLFSVYPQEFLYRTFFFNRYIILFKTPYALIAVNALIFSFAHIAFKDLLVSGLTLIGGILFAFTYHKSKSIMVTSIEHALYGSWLFTLGMGEMLAFPVPQ